MAKEKKDQLREDVQALRDEVRVQLHLAGMDARTAFERLTEERVAAPAATPDARAHASEIGGALAAAISALPPDHREALVLRDVEGLSAEEAAKVAGVDVGALKSRCTAHACSFAPSCRRCSAKATRARRRRVPSSPRS